MAVRAMQDIKNGLHDVPPWGWGLILLGTLYLVLHRSSATAAAAANQAASAAGAPTLLVPGSSQPVTDQTGGFSSYVDQMNSLWAQTGESLRASQQTLADNQNQEASQIQTLLGQVAGLVAAQSDGSGRGLPGSPGGGSPPPQYIGPPVYSTGPEPPGYVQPYPTAVDHAAQWWGVAALSGSPTMYDPQGRSTSVKTWLPAYGSGGTISGYYDPLAVYGAIGAFQYDPISGTIRYGEKNNGGWGSATTVQNLTSLFSSAGRPAPPVNPINPGSH